MSGRLLVLLLVGIVTAAMSRRLAAGEARAHAAHAEAARLTELDQQRTDFVSSVTHELQTPLTAARAGIGMVLMSSRDRLEDAERRLLANAERNIGRLALLIEDLLAFNQIEVGTLRLERTRLDLRDVAEAAAGALQPLIVEKEQTLTIDLPEPLEVDGDPRRLEQVVADLLSNAHTHTPSGTRITLAGRRTERGVRLTLRDTGPGLPEEELGRVFGRFYRYGPTGGSGLGLAIARALVELHGGTVWAGRPAGGGIAFHVELPRAAPTQG